MSGCFTRCRGISTWQMYSASRTNFTPTNPNSIDGYRRYSDNVSLVPLKLLAYRWRKFLFKVQTDQSTNDRRSSTKSRCNYDTHRFSSGPVTRGCGRAEWNGCNHRNPGNQPGAALDVRLNNAASSHFTLRGNGMPKRKPKIPDPFVNRIAVRDSIDVYADEMPSTQQVTSSGSPLNTPARSEFRFFEIASNHSKRFCSGSTPCWKLTALWNRICKAILVASIPLRFLNNAVISTIVLSLCFLVCGGTDPYFI